MERTAPLFLKTNVETAAPVVGSVGGASQSVIIFLQYYLPGVKAGGPIRSIANLVDVLGKEVRFRIVTSDRDIKDRLPYRGIARNHWLHVGNAEVIYLSPGWPGLRTLISILLSAGREEVLYVNSFFSRRFSVLPLLLRWTGFIKPQKVVLAPRGEFSQGALGLKNGRKRFYLALSRLFGIYGGVVFHASSKYEALDIADAIKKADVIQIAGVVPANPEKPHQDPISRKPLQIQIAEDIARFRELGLPARTKECGHLRIVFASRICPMKNLIGALRIMNGIDGDVAFDIYGPAEDRKYWAECQDAIALLPSNIQVKYHGVIEHDRLADVFAQSDLFFLPTLGENYGHVICEAMSAGCPVLISDRTPWKNLEPQLAGWDVPLEDTARFRTILKECVEGDQARQTTLAIGAQSYARQRLALPEVFEANLRLFSPPDIKRK